MDLTSGKIKAIIWATGYRPDYSWLEVPVLDRKGRNPARRRGRIIAGDVSHRDSVPAPPKIRPIDGAGDDARDLSAHLMSYLDSRLA